MHTPLFEVSLPTTTRIIPFLSSYLSYTQRSLVYHTQSYSYHLTVPEPILTIFPVYVPFQHNLLVIVFRTAITLSRLTFQNKKLYHTCLYVFSTPINSVQDYSTFTTKDLHFVILFNATSVFSFTHPVAGLRSLAQIAETPFTVGRSKIKTTHYTLPSHFHHVACNNTQDFISASSVFSLSPTGELTLVLAETPLAMVCDKTHLCIATKEHVLYGTVTSSGFTTEITIPHTAIAASGLYIDNSVVLAVETQENTMLHRFANPHVMMSFEKGECEVFGKFGLFDDLILLSIRTPTSVGLHHLNKTETGLPLIPQSDCPGADAQAVATKRAALPDLSRADMKAFYEDLETTLRQFEEKERQREEEKSRPVRSYKKTLDLARFESLAVAPEKLAVLDRYMTQFAKVTAVVSESQDLLKEIGELVDRCDNDMSSLCEMTNSMIAISR